MNAALELLDEVGLEGLTVRAVAGRLGVQAPALYWHVRNKQDLLDEMATEIWRRITAEFAGARSLPWKVAMRVSATITRRTLLAHRDGAKVFSGTYLTDVDVLEQQEEGLAWITEQGFTLEAAVRAWSLLYNFTIGFTIEEQAVAQAAASGDERYTLAHRAARLDSSTYPLVIRAGPEIFGDPESRFADLVTVIIDAADRMRTSR